MAKPIPKKSQPKSPLLTRKQLDVLRFFRDYHQEHGISPTLEEAAEVLGVSKITVYEHLNHLVAKGAVHRDKARARAVEVRFDPDAGRKQRHAGTSSISLLGSIAAGRPIEAIEDPEAIALDELIPSDGKHYLLRVEGKSMIEDHIDHGDLVLVERRESAQNGEVVVAIVGDGEATLKRFYREDGRIRLQPANSMMQPTFPQQVEIRGIVKGVIRRFR